MDVPHIEVKHPQDAYKNDVANTYNMDTGPLAMPKHIAIGQRTWDGEKINNYSDQVGEYDIWLGEQIQKENVEIMQELEVVFSKAISAGVILTTVCMPNPFSTHAHMVRRTIMELSSQQNEE